MEWFTKETWGPQTAMQARQMTRFNPDKSWQQVALE